MHTIPQRELRNNASGVLRRAEQGERFTITVDGRPVAELGPPSLPRGFGTAAALAEILDDLPVDRAWAAELARLRAREDEAVAPAERG